MNKKLTDKDIVTTYHHGDLRQVIIDEALKIIREQGQEALSMRKLAGQIGVSRTAPYHHFADKHSLLCAIAVQGFKRFVLFTENPDSMASEVGEEGMRALICRYVGFSTGNREYYDLMFGGQLWGSDKVSEDLQRESRASFKDYVDRIRAWSDAGLVSTAVDPLRFAQVSFSTLHGMSRMLIDGIYVDKNASEAMIETTAKMFWSQLHLPESSPKPG